MNLVELRRSGIPLAREAHRWFDEASMRSNRLSTSQAFSTTYPPAIVCDDGENFPISPAERIASALQPILDRLDSEGHFGIVRLIQDVARVVGETIARRTEVAIAQVPHRGGEGLGGAMWIQELNLMKMQILSRPARSDE